jgi:hypothetical protein
MTNTQRDAFDGDWPEGRSPAMRGWAIWREIAVGLGIAAIGILITLCVARGGMAQPRPPHGHPAAAVSAPSKL